MQDKRKKSLIRTYLKLTGFDEEYLMHQDNNFVLLQQRHQLSEEDYVELYNKYGKDYLKEQIVNLFSEEFAEKEIEEMIKFWTSDVGKKLGSKQFREKQKKVGGEWAINLERSFLQKSNEFKSK